MPQSTIIKEERPTVQVNLLASPEMPQQAPSETRTPAKPHVAMSSKKLALPMPLQQTPRSQPTIAPLQASLTPTPPVKQALTPPVSIKPILQDTRASQALKSENNDENACAETHATNNSLFGNANNSNAHSKACDATFANAAKKAFARTNTLLPATNGNTADTSSHSASSDRIIRDSPNNPDIFQAHVPPNRERIWMGRHRHGPYTHRRHRRTKSGKNSKELWAPNVGSGCTRRHFTLEISTRKGWEYSH